MNTIKVAPIDDALDVDRPVWSVMIPTYNCSTYLKTTLQSVLNQDQGRHKMEIWVVDDHSSDDPQQVIRDLGAGRVGFYRQEKNVGQLNNFSTCLNLARGKIIHLLHGDDFVYNGFYESLEPYLLNRGTVGAAFTGHNMVDEEGNLIVQSEPLSEKAGIIDDFLSIITCKQVIQTPSIVVKREVYEKIGAFNKNLTWVEDWEMWIRIACDFDFYYDPRVLSAYRVHSKSNTEDSVNTGRFIKDVLKCVNVYSSYLKGSKQEKTKIINSAKQHYLNFAIQQGRYRQSVIILFRAFELSYNRAAFFQILTQIPKVAFKYLKNSLKIHLGAVRNFVFGAKRKS